MHRILYTVKKIKMNKTKPFNLKKKKNRNWSPFPGTSKLMRIKYIRQIQNKTYSLSQNMWEEKFIDID